MLSLAFTSTGKATSDPGWLSTIAVASLFSPQRIGHSCTVNQGVSVASVRGTGWPTIGNNVYLGAGCKVMGGVTVGDNVVVSANSLVIADVPSNCTVLGVPARIISRQTVSPHISNLRV